MTEKFRIAQLAITILIASQGLFYLMGGAEALKNISVAAFAEQRKAIDSVIAGRMRILYYLALITGIISLVLLRKGPAELPFICTLLATLFILADVLIALKFNLPINQQFQKLASAQVNFKQLQLDWLRLITLRGVLSVLSLFLLLFTLIRQS